MASVGTASVDIIPNMGPLNQGLANALSPMKLKKLGAAGGVALGVGFAATGITKVLFDVGAAFDDAYDTIRVETGKTGKAFNGLKADLKEVVKTTPTDMGKASKAIAALNTRVGLTGKPLQKMAKQMLELSRITDTDVNENIAASTRLFGDWSVKTKDQSDTLDGLFRLTQETGVGFADLNRLLVQFGSPLRNLGLDLDFSAAMFAKFEKEGVNTQTLMPGLRMALKNFGKAGKDPQKALTAAFKGIKDGTVSLTDAFEIFGGRAAPDMYAAIREGRFSLDVLMDSFHEGRDTITGAAADTNDFSESWLMFKNKVLVGLEPIATKVFDSISEGMDRLAAFDFESIRQKFNNMFGSGGGPGLGKFGADISSTFAVIKNEVGPILSNLGTIANATIVPIFRRTLPGLIQRFQGFAQVVRGVVRVISGVLSGDFSKAWEGVKDIFSGSLKAIWGMLRSATATARELASRIGNAIWGGIKSVGSKLPALGKWLVDRLLDGIKAYYTPVLAAGKWLVNKAIDGIQSRLKGVYSIGKSVVSKTIEGVKSLGTKLKDMGKWIIDKIKSGFSALVPKVKMPDLNPFNGKKGGKGGGNVGPGNGSGGLGAATALAAKFGNMVTSGYRPGDDGYHGQNRARDYAGGNMIGFAKAAAGKFGGKLLELIHTPLGYGIKNGARVPLSFWGSAVNADHFDHVHVAMRRGGKAGPSMGGPKVVYGEGKKTEWWISQEGDKKKNTQWALEALEALSGPRLAMYKSGKGPKKKKQTAAQKKALKKKRERLARERRAGKRALKPSQFDADLAAAELTEGTEDDAAVLRKRVSYNEKIAAKLERLLKRKGLPASRRKAYLDELASVRGEIKSDRDTITSFSGDLASATGDGTGDLSAAITANTEAQRDLQKSLDANRKFAEQVNTAHKSVTGTTLADMQDRSLGGHLTQMLLTLSPRMAT